MIPQPRPSVTNITHGAAFLCFDTPMSATQTKGSTMTKMTTVSQRAVSEGGTLAKDIKPGDLIRTHVATAGVAVLAVTPFRSEGTPMVYLKLRGGYFAMMPETCDCDVEAKAPSVAAFADSLGALVGMPARPMAAI